MGKTSSTTSGYLPFADDLDDPTEVCTAVLKDWSSRIFLDGNCQWGRPQGCQKIPYFRRFFLELYGSAFWKIWVSHRRGPSNQSTSGGLVSESGGSTAVPIEFQGCHSADSGVNHQSYQRFMGGIFIAGVSLKCGTHQWLIIIVYHHFPWSIWDLPWWSPFNGWS